LADQRGEPSREGSAGQSGLCTQFLDGPPPGRVRWMLCSAARIAGSSRPARWPPPTATLAVLVALSACDRDIKLVRWSTREGRALADHRQARLPGLVSPAVEATAPAEARTDTCKVYDDAALCLARFVRRAYEAVEGHYSAEDEQIERFRISLRIFHHIGTSRPTTPRRRANGRRIAVWSSRPTQVARRLAPSVRLDGPAGVCPPLMSRRSNSPPRHVRPIGQAP
jgi:hypothetical protein